MTTLFRLMPRSIQATLWPLLNLKGEVIGINSAIFSRGGGNIGIGFAIPIDQAKSIISQLRESGKVTRGWLGVMIQPVTKELADSFGLKEPKGALVAEVTEDGPAKKAGLERGDVITTFNGVTINDSVIFLRCGSSSNRL